MVIKMEDKYSFPVSSAVFNTVDNLLFIKDSLSYKVKFVYNDQNNLKVRDEERLKKILFHEIMIRYNSRIDKYELTAHHISHDVFFKNFHIDKFSFSDKYNCYGGHFQIFPRTFFCENEKCGHLSMINRNDDWQKFNVLKCPICGDKYRQSTVVRFCETCGKVENLYFKCEHGPYNWKLIMGEKDQPSTWKAECTKCTEGPIDINPYPCKHEEFGYKISRKKPNPYKILTVMENTVFSSETITIVDAPKYQIKSSGDLAYVLLGIYFQRFKDLEENIGFELTIDDIEDLLTYLDSDSKFIDQNKMNIAKKVENIINMLKNQYAKKNIENIVEYFIIKGLFNEVDDNKNFNYNDFLDNINVSDLKNELSKKYNLLKENFYIENIAYIPDIQLINSAIGFIKGPNKFYEEGFVPHFEPFFDKDKKSFKAMSYPFETEGILFELDKIKVVEWLIANEKIEDSGSIDRIRANEILFDLNEADEAYKDVKTLIHTLSHILINRSSLFTGLDSGTCGELVFTNSASFLIYSNSNVNIGGFLFVFENSLSEWFNDVKLDLKDCVFDPTCLHDDGACFSCLYLPEHVCRYFNADLDRDVLLGKIRYKKGFWE